MIIRIDSNVPKGKDDRFEKLIDCVEIDGIYMLDCSGHVLTWNRGAELVTGYRRDEIIGRHFKIFYPPEEIELGAPEGELEQAMRTGRSSGEGWRLRKNGERFWASFVLTAMWDADQRLIGYARVIRDLSDRKRQEDALRCTQAALQEERDRLHAAAESSLDALFICEALRDDKGKIHDFMFSFLNTNVEKLVNLPRTSLLGGRMCELIPTIRPDGLFDKYKQVVLTGKPLVEEYQTKDDAVRTTWLRIQAVKLRDGIAITVSDITERKRNEQSIEHLAQHDRLTGLPNRNLLEDRMNQSIAMAKRERSMVGVLLIDLDGFKQINDTLGHDTGDEVLCTVANRLSAVMRASDSLIRMGGDEFLAIAPGIKRLQELIIVVDKILNSIRPPIFCGNHKILLTCSIGIAVYPDSAVSGPELLKRADVAMYASKHGGKNQYKLFGHRTSKLRKQA